MEHSLSWWILSTFSSGRALGWPFHDRHGQHMRGVFKEAHQLGLPWLWQSITSCALETQISFEILGNFPYHMLSSDVKGGTEALGYKVKCLHCPAERGSSWQVAFESSFFLATLLCCQRCISSVLYFLLPFLWVANQPAGYLRV